MTDVSGAEPQNATPFWRHVTRVTTCFVLAVTAFIRTRSAVMGVMPIKYTVMDDFLPGF